MDLSVTISIIAIIVSLGSLGVAIWATRISKTSLDHAIKVQEKSDEKEIEMLRSELLMQLADNRRILDKTRIEIGTIKADFDAQPHSVQVMMSNYIDLFTSYLPKVEASIQQLDGLWQEISGWSKEKEYKELMEAKAVFYRSQKDDEVVYDSGMYMVNEFKMKLALAKEHIGIPTK